MLQSIWYRPIRPFQRHSSFNPEHLETAVQIASSCIPTALEASHFLISQHVAKLHRKKNRTGTRRDASSFKRLHSSFRAKQRRLKASIAEHISPQPAWASIKRLVKHQKKFTPKSPTAPTESFYADNATLVTSKFGATSIERVCVPCLRPHLSPEPFHQHSETCYRTSSPQDVQ